ncbi:hypothetical protein M406DRAFT_107822 [Cryphonectria parasitica EP155]|uniref:Uncharacterized protein n=1 Tax=Cryphonectria parasitica (strain ATCC 38755 / EP155) TaxID=660469 RepID=A0A9P4XWZ5_CRYP1|nr:uncharacterized protein M406DRAFT_107822 [Cryphonectria parasitica EP155]KAF3762295.1 hypothetical protein M406DRAFT_107822 [Cryphonectria parasitica EP155]
MDELWLSYPVAGQPVDHGHKGYAHDEGCVPAKNVQPEWLDLDFGQFYGTGAAPMAHYHGEYASHDTSCLDGSGCPRLGLDPGVNDKEDLAAVMPQQQPPPPSFDVLAQSSMPYQAFSASLGDFNTTLPPRVHTPDPTLLGAASISPLSQVSRSPEDHLHHISEEDADSDADSLGSCDSHCLGSGGACSAGTCADILFEDEETACRDENCQKPIVEPDVAHSAFILQGISGAMQQQAENPQLNRNTFQQTMVDSTTNHIHTAQSQSFGQSYQFPFHFQAGFPAASSHTLQGNTARHSEGNVVGGQEFSGNFPQNFHQFHELPPSLASSQVQYANALDNSQTMSLAQQLDSNTNVFSWAPLYDTQGAFVNAVEQVYDQQALRENTSTALDPGLSDTNHSQWLPGSTQNFQFSEPLDENLLGISQEQGSSSNLPTGTQESVTTMSDDFSPTSRDQSSPSKSLGSVARTISPVSDYSMKGISVGSESMSREIEAHVCQWRLADNRICGQQFSSHSLLHDHVDDTHFHALKPTSEHGLVCLWDGCDRLTNDKYADKRGFDTKSKLRRHIETHTGPSTF